MSWTVALDFASAVFLIVSGVYVNAGDNIHVLLFKIVPIILAFALTLSAAARLFGWPI